MRKFIHLYKFVIFTFCFALLAKTAKTQVVAASWIGFNAVTDKFPLHPSIMSAAVLTSATLEINGMQPINSELAAFQITERNKHLQPESPHLSFKLDLFASAVRFDKFILHNVISTGDNFFPHIRWSIDSFSRDIASFTRNNNLFVADLSHLDIQIGKPIEFRVFYSSFSGQIMHNESINEGESKSYKDYHLPGAIMSIWIKEANVPVRVEEFRGRYHGGDIQLKWQAPQQKNISHFEIERSTDGKIFHKAGSVTAGTTTSKYHYTDRTKNDSSTHIIYYRMWMLDNSGSAAYSGTIPILVKKENDIMVIIPAKDSAMVVINSRDQRNVRYTISDAGNQIVQTGRCSLQPGGNTKFLDVKDLAHGIYRVNIKGTEINLSSTFVK